MKKSESLSGFAFFIDKYLIVDITIKHSTSQDKQIDLKKFLTATYS